MRIAMSVLSLLVLSSGQPSIVFASTVRQGQNEFTYSDKGNNFKVTQRTLSVGVFLDKNLAPWEDACNEKLVGNSTYYHSLFKNYSKKDAVKKYEFIPNTPTQDGNYTVYVLPNKLARPVDFDKTFSQCAAGVIQPKLSSKKYLIFEQVCGTGYDDSSGRPHGCEQVSNIISGSIRLK